MIRPCSFFCITQNDQLKNHAKIQQCPCGHQSLCQKATKQTLICIFNKCAAALFARHCARCWDIIIMKLKGWQWRDLGETALPHFVSWDLAKIRLCSFTHKESNNHLALKDASILSSIKDSPFRAASMISRCLALPPEVPISTVKHLDFRWEGEAHTVFFKFLMMISWFFLILLLSIRAPDFRRSLCYLSADSWKYEFTELARIIRKIN